MNIDLELDAIFVLLKEHLKAKKISYKEVAQRLKMSESNVKRIFSTQSCSLLQAAQICSVTKTSLVELMAIAGKRIAPEFILPSETESFFLNNFEAFVFYRHLFAADDPHAYIESSSLTKERIQFYLKQFENFKLLKLKRGKIELLGRGYLNLSQCPKLDRKLNEKWVPWFMDQVLHCSKNSDHYLKTMSTGLSHIHRAQLIEDIERIFQRYRDIGAQDQSLGSGDFESVGVCLGIGPHRVGFFEVKKLSSQALIRQTL